MAQQDRRNGNGVSEHAYDVVNAKTPPHVFGKHAVITATPTGVEITWGKSEPSLFRGGAGNAVEEHG
ncbi:MAG TPA: hypothetical protein VG102_01945 [Candidatus Paceibacterota bacterium]|jgi:hypothetical protein|nr:hypothetical protein [Candidatus Paceibacterota bacterium]